MIDVEEREEFFVHFLGNEKAREPGSNKQNGQILEDQAHQVNETALIAAILGFALRSLSYMYFSGWKNDTTDTFLLADSQGQSPLHSKRRL